MAYSKNKIRVGFALEPEDYKTLVWIKNNQGYKSFSTIFVSLLRNYYKYTKDFYKELSK